MRHSSIDLLRGFIMICMALDHASVFIGRVHFSEFWGVQFIPYPDGFWWFTRFISHLCAPGFFLLMGMSIVLFAQNRTSKNWSFGQIRNYFLRRALVILGCMYLLEFPAWGFGNYFSTVHTDHPIPGYYEEGFLLPSTVLMGLALCMMIGAFLWRCSKWILLAISILSFALSTWYIEIADPSIAYNPLMHFFIVPGLSKGAICLYPIIPWLGITSFGMFLAILMSENTISFYAHCLKIGLGFVGMFFLLRFLEIGNFQMNAYSTWIEFFTLIKYPPSLSFAFLTVGINLILLHIFSKSFGRPWLRPLLVFGQTAMFFYIVHLYIYALLGIPFPTGAAIWLLYIIWILGLIPLYYMCQWFLNFQKSKSASSFWRYI